jgi:hypothetical protein
MGIYFTMPAMGRYENRKQDFGANARPIHSVIEFNGTCCKTSKCPDDTARKHTNRNDKPSLISLLGVTYL